MTDTFEPILTMSAPSLAEFRTYPVCRVPIADLDTTAAAARIVQAAAAGISYEVHLCNAYTLSLVDRDPLLRMALAASHMNLADGTPVAWLGRSQGEPGPVRGPGLVGAVAALGLGVALAQQLATLHGGGLRGRRPPGARRVRFTLTLPLDAAADAVALAADTTLPVASETGLSVLLADDNVDFSHSFGTMLELLGHRVAVVHDGLAALAAIVASPPDIAFLDIGMPTLDGVEAVRRVRGQGNRHDVLLVAVTGRGGTEDRARAAEAGFDRYLVKPFAMQDVRDALDAARGLRG